MILKKVVRDWVAAVNTAIEVMASIPLMRKSEEGRKSDIIRVLWVHFRSNVFDSQVRRLVLVVKRKSRRWDPWVGRLRMVCSSERRRSENVAATYMRGCLKG